jgi:hypothetical protein
MRLRTLATVTGIAVASWLGVAPNTNGQAAPTCEARPVVDEFIAALNAADIPRLDELFAPEGDGWVWYFVNDRAGRRLGSVSRRRDTLRAYFTARVRQHEKLHLLRFADSGNGNFTFVLRRRADDLRGATPVTRVGKGWVSCRTGKIGVWGLGGAPRPATFGPCPQGALPLGRADVGSAAVAVLRFVREVYSELAPSLDVAGARVTRATLAPGNVKSYSARVKCGRETQRRTIVVEVRFPRVAADDPSSAGAFYVSRTHGGWLVWRLVR